MKALTIKMLFVFLALSSLTQAKDRDMLIVIPGPTIGRDPVFRFEYNIQQKGTIALDWTEWAGEGREELGSKELKQRPKDSLRSKGRELSLMFGRYANPDDMSGFHWGLGLGAREMKAQWLHTPAAGIGPDGVALADATQLHHDLRAMGPTSTARVGYRWVHDGVGATIGTFAALKHFQNTVSDQEKSEDALHSATAYEDKVALKRRFTTSLRIGLELGWAF